MENHKYQFPMGKVEEPQNAALFSLYTGLRWKTRDTMAKSPSVWNPHRNRNRL